VTSHNPICSCPPGYTGDPLSSCRPAPPPVGRGCFLNSGYVGTLKGFLHFLSLRITSDRRQQVELFLIWSHDVARQSFHSFMQTDL
jgi:hypothetical protein